MGFQMYTTNALNMGQDWLGVCSTFKRITMNQTNTLPCTSHLYDFQMPLTIASILFWHIPSPRPFINAKIYQTQHKMLYKLQEYFWWPLGELLAKMDHHQGNQIATCITVMHICKPLTSSVADLCTLDASFHSLHISSSEPWTYSIKFHVGRTIIKIACDTRQ